MRSVTVTQETKTQCYTLSSPSPKGCSDKSGPLFIQYILNSERHPIPAWISTTVDTVFGDPDRMDPGKVEA